MPDAGQHYEGAPITEAVIDIKAIIPDEVGASPQESMGVVRLIKSGLSLLLPSYKAPEDITRHVSQLKVGGQNSATATASNVVGAMFQSEDKRQILQARLDGFTFSRLAPYTTWEDFSTQARAAWGAYRQTFPAMRVTRLAVRYINRIEFPTPADDLAKYVTLLPTIPDNLTSTGALSGLFMQLKMPMRDGANLILNEAIVESNSPDTAAILLDTDIYRDTDVPQDEAGIWEYFSTLRDLKNEVFEACITPTTRELIK